MTFVISYNDETINGETLDVLLLQHDIGLAYPVKGTVP